MMIRQILAEIWWTNFSRQRRRNHHRNASCPCLESLEDRALLSATANLVAYRPVTQYFDHTEYAVAEADEVDENVGPGIRINGDDDDQNGKADSLDKTPSVSPDNDLIRVDALGEGSSFQLTWSGPLAVWTTTTKAAAVANGASVTPGQSLWVEYVSTAHTVGSSTQMWLTASDNLSTITDSVVFHSFRSIVIAIGGNTQDPGSFGDPNLGTFTMAGELYGSGYDVYMFANDQVQSSGAGAAYDEVVSAVLNRNVDNAAIYGYSWGGGATYDLSAALNSNSSLTSAGYKLKYTAYVDGIRQSSVSSETRKPVGTAYHDNFYQRNDFFLKGNSVSGAHNINVTNTSWGGSLGHTTIDDNLTLQDTLIQNLKTRLIVQVALTSPVGSTFDVSPIFKWEAVPDTSRYDIWVDKNQPSFKSKVIRNELVPTNSYEVSTSLGVGTYTWWVRAYDADGLAGDWSSPKSFTIDRPSVTGPAPVTLNTTPTITWTNLESSRYELWVNQVGVKQKIIYRADLTATSFTPTTPLPNGTYDVWVRPIAADGEAGLWSLGYRFQMDYRVGPVPVSPAGVTTDRKPTFTWAAIDGAGNYDLWVDNLTTGKSQVIRQTVPHASGATQITYTPAAPIAAGNYRWWVLAATATGVRSAWSVAANFQIPVPTIVSPVGTITTRTPLFQWNGVAEFKTYEVWVDNLTTGRSRVLHMQNLTNTFYAPALPMEVGSFRVWVRGFDKDGLASQWSAFADFTISATN